MLNIQPTQFIYVVNCNNYFVILWLKQGSWYWLTTYNKLSVVSISGLYMVLACGCGLYVLTLFNLDFFSFLNLGVSPPPSPSPCNFKAIKATAMRLGECKVCPKLFPLRSAKWTSDVTSCEDDHTGIINFVIHSHHVESTILDISISPKLKKTGQIGSKFMKTNE